MPTLINHRKCPNWSLIVSVSDERVLDQTLMKSPAIDERCQVIIRKGFACAGGAYNAGISEARNEIMVFAHQDVYLPESWLRDLAAALDRLQRTDPHWGVLGVYGISDTRERDGFVYSTGLKATLGMRFVGAIEALTLDELLLIVRRSSGLFFDEKLPGFHLYGADLCAQAREESMKSYIIPAFCIHNSNGIQHLPGTFWRSYFYLRWKWWNHLPITTCCTTITKGCLPVARSVFSDFVALVRGSKIVGRRSDNPALLYQTLRQESGLERPPAASAL